jgi:ribonuclease P protein component
MRLPRNRRITQRRDFARVRRQGNTWRGHFLLLGVLEDETLEDIKIGFITTRKLGNAVTRNRVRRRLRGVFQRLGDSLKAGAYLVVIPRKDAATASSQALEKEWKWLVRRSGLYKGGQGE